VLGQHRAAVPHRRVGNARWGGTPLAPLLRQAGVSGEASEVVFWGADRGEVTFTTTRGRAVCR
jgi:DMSO/TMAO reductase YedYZ molybdopterin-dependent catalytic subunit